jgi:hypothetical protein
MEALKKQEDAETNALICCVWPFAPSFAEHVLKTKNWNYVLLQRKKRKLWQQLIPWHPGGQLHLIRVHDGLVLGVILRLEYSVLVVNNSVP